MRLRDFKGLFKKSLAEVISVENPHEDYYLIKLKSNVKWLPGEHGIFSLSGKKVEGKKWRAFSVASITGENYMLLGTRTGEKISSFKEEMIQMKKGDLVGVRGPFGWFKLEDDKKAIVLAASGVGITPIRALLKSIEKDTTRKVEIIYGGKDFYLFEEEILGLSQENPQINFRKTTGKEAFIKALKEVALKDPTAYYYLSGSPNFIKSAKEQLKSMGIKKIINDPFLGY